MARNEPHLSYRFVVLYRREPREIKGAAEEWRGWLCRVPDALEEAGGTETERVWFRDLRELPALIQDFIVSAAPTDTAGNDQSGR